MRLIICLVFFFIILFGKCPEAETRIPGRCIPTMGYGWHSDLFSHPKRHIIDQNFTGGNVFHIYRGLADNIYVATSLIFDKNPITFSPKHNDKLASLLEPEIFVTCMETVWRWDLYKGGPILGGSMLVNEKEQTMSYICAGKIILNNPFSKFMVGSDYKASEICDDDPEYAKKLKEIQDLQDVINYLTDLVEDKLSRRKMVAMLYPGFTKDENSKLPFNCMHSLKDKSSLNGSFAPISIIYPECDDEADNIHD